MLFGALQISLSLTQSLAVRMPLLHANAPQLACQLRTAVAATVHAIVQAELTTTPRMAARHGRRALAQVQAAQQVLQAATAAHPLIFGSSDAAQHLHAFISTLQHHTGTAA